MSCMTHRERLLAAVDLQETDRPPVDFGGTLATTIVPSTYEKLKTTWVKRMRPLSDGNGNSWSCHPSLF